MRPLEGLVNWGAVLKPSPSTLRDRGLPGGPFDRTLLPQGGARSEVVYSHGCEDCGEPVRNASAQRCSACAARERQARTAEAREAADRKRRRAENLREGYGWDW